MTLIATVAALLATPPIVTAEPAAHRVGCRPCTYSPHNHRAALRARRHARRELAHVRWYLRRHNATRPYRAWLASTGACESGGNYATNTGNGFYGRYQFTLSSWRAAGGRGMPNLAPPLEQDFRAVRLLHIQGAGAWPVCG